MHHISFLAHNFIYCTPCNKNEFSAFHDSTVIVHKGDLGCIWVTGKQNKGFKKPTLVWGEGQMPFLSLYITLLDRCCLPYLYIYIYIYIYCITSFVGQRIQTSISIGRHLYSYHSNITSTLLIPWIMHPYPN